MTLTQDIALLLPVTALLPLTAILLVAQANPYQTLVLRGILGAVCALIYALLGAADVALTEALVGTLLSTTLYAVALRSSMVLRVAVAAEPPSQPLHEQLQEQLRSWLDPLSLRLELLSPTDPDLHAVLEPSGRSGSYCLGRFAGAKRVMVLNSSLLPSHPRGLLHECGCRCLTFSTAAAALRPCCLGAVPSTAGSGGASPP